MAINLVIIFPLIVFLILFLLLYIHKKKYKRSTKIITSFSSFIPSLREKKFNPDINTDNWDIHKIRLEKFRRSQYKGLTFFLSSEDRIYYLSEKGSKVYC